MKVIINNCEIELTDEQLKKIDAYILKQTSMIECYFVPIKNGTSSTICANCGLEKFQHTIGKGIKSTKMVIYNVPISSIDETEFKRDYEPQKIKA